MVNVVWKVGNWVGGMAVRENKVRQAAGRTLAESKHALAILLWNCLGRLLPLDGRDLGAGR